MPTPGYHSRSRKRSPRREVAFGNEFLQSVEDVAKFLYELNKVLYGLPVAAGSIISWYALGAIKRFVTSIVDKLTTTNACANLEIELEAKEAAKNDLISKRGTGANAAENSAIVHKITSISQEIENIKKQLVNAGCAVDEATEKLEKINQLLKKYPLNISINGNVVAKYDNIYTILNEIYEETSKGPNMFSRNTYNTINRHNIPFSVGGAAPVSTLFSTANVANPNPTSIFTVRRTFGKRKRRHIRSRRRSRRR